MRLYAMKACKMLQSGLTDAQIAAGDPAQNKDMVTVSVAQARKGIRGLANEWRVRLSRFIFGWRRPFADVRSFRTVGRD